MRGKANQIKWLLCVLFLACPAQAKYGGGTGESNDPYLIYTPEQMNTIGAEPNDWDKHFKLMADIDLSRYRAAEFNIIGNGFLPAFTGVFDGNSHTISNFTCTSTGKPCVGIFGYIDGPDARISNLGLIDPNVDGGTGIGVGSLAGWVETGTITDCYATDAGIAGKTYVGGLAGHNGGSITDCHASGKVTGISDVGGLVGQNSGSITGCRASGEVSGIYDVGGLVGGNYGFGADGGWYSRGNIERCYAAGIVDGLRAIGGLVGTNRAGVVTDSYSTCDVKGGNSAGGLVGENDGSVGNCYSDCTVDAEDMVGGLVGQNDGIIMASCSSVSLQGREDVGGLVGYNFYRGQIVDCYTLGDVLGIRYVGGLLGYNPLATSRGGELLYGTVRTCYSAAAVAGDEHAGGLIGYDPGGGVHDSFWDIEISGRRASAGGVGKTTAQMNDPNTFIQAGWDFVDESVNGTEDVWAMPDGGGYPILWWQLSVLPELPAFSGGTGEPNDPYLVATADELNSIGHNPRLMAAHFKLVSDIDLAGVNFHIMANQYYPFGGTFDGNGCTISNFKCTSADAGYVGLFRYVAGGQIKDLRLMNPIIRTDKGNMLGSLVGLLEAGTVTRCHAEAGSVAGQDEIGGLVGENTSSGSITSCSYAGSVAGRDDVGGLAGRNKGRVAYSYSQSSIKGRNAIGGLVGRCAPGQIVNCYAHGDVMGQWYIGGLVGTNSAGAHSLYVGAIRKCYSATAILGGSQSGGLLGADWGGEIRDCFWDIQTSGRTTSHGGTGKTTAEMQMASTFLDAGWDFAGETANGAEDTWWILEGQDYPRLAWENMPGPPVPGPTYGGGAGTAEDPYLIYTPEQMNEIGLHQRDWDKHFKLMVDIDLSGFDGKDGRPTYNVIAPDADAGKWDFQGTAFNGVFDGNSHRIWRLTIEGTNYLGLFGCLGPEAEVNDLGVLDANITGSDCYIGSLAGSSGGYLTRCYAGGAVGGDSYVGGLTGCNQFGHLANCSSTGATRGRHWIGGLVGLNSGTISNCCSEGAISGSSWRVGGLAGENRHTVTNSYSMGPVGGSGYVGGLVGHNAGDVIHCYSTGAVRGSSEVGGLVGDNRVYTRGSESGSPYDGIVTQSFWDVETSGQTASAGGVGKTTAEMQTANTFLEAGWDFAGETTNGAEDTWWILEGKDYPRLWWEPAGGDGG